MDKEILATQVAEQMEKLVDAPCGCGVRIVSLPSGDDGHRLEVMGLRVGKVVQKVSGMPMKGPVTISLEGRHFAVGHGVASHIAVERAV